MHAKLEAARQETLGRAANDVQRQWLDETLGKHKIVEHFDIADHAGRQSVAWQKSINRGRLDRLNQQAGRDHADPKMVEALANASEGSARDHARASGLRPDSPEAQAEVDIARSSVFRHAIEGALAKGAQSTAIKLHERARDKLVPGDAEFLDKIIEDVREMKIGKDYVAKIAPLSLTLNTSLEDLDKAQDEATAKNNEDWKDNDKQRAANQHFINVRFGKAKHQVEMDKAKLAQTVHDWLTTPGPDGLLQTERPPFAIWGKLTYEERKDVETILEANARGSTVTGDFDADRANQEPAEESENSIHSPNIVLAQIDARDFEEAQAPQKKPATPPLRKQANPAPTPKKGKGPSAPPAAALTEEQKRLREIAQNKRREERRMEFDSWGLEKRPPNAPKQPMPTDWEKKLPAETLKALDDAAERHGIPRELLARILWMESEFKEDAGRDTKATGKGIAGLTPIAINQLIKNAPPGSARRAQLEQYKKDNARMQAAPAIDMAAEYFRYLYDISGKTWPKAIAAYKEGPTALRDWLRGDDFSDPGRKERGQPPIAPRKGEVTGYY